MKLFNALSLLLLSCTHQVAMAGNGGGGEQATTAPPVVGEGCIRVNTLDMFYYLAGGPLGPMRDESCGGLTIEDCSYGPPCEGPNYFSEVLASAGTCPDYNVKLCVDVVGTGTGVDFDMPGTCDDGGEENDSNFLELAFDVNDLASAIGFSPSGGTISSCESYDADDLFDFLALGYSLELSTGWIHICPTTSICPNDKQRQPGGRRLDEDHQDFGMIVDKCANYDYEGSLFVTDHLYALGVPGEEAKKHGCPYVAVHSIVGDLYDSMSTTARKEILLWDNKEDFDNKFSAEGAYSFGDFPLSNLVEAYLKADVTATSNTQQARVYDVIGNSCGHFMVNLAGHLGVKIDTDVTAFVARRLLENSGKDLVAKIRSSAYLPSLLKGSARRLRSDSAQDDELVAALVETTASGALEH